MKDRERMEDLVFVWQSNKITSFVGICVLKIHSSIFPPWILQTQCLLNTKISILCGFCKWIWIFPISNALKLPEWGTFRCGEETDGAHHWLSLFPRSLGWSPDKDSNNRAPVLLPANQNYCTRHQECEHRSLKNVFMETVETNKISTKMSTCRYIHWSFSF